MFAKYTDRVFVEYFKNTWDYPRMHDIGYGLPGLFETGKIGQARLHSQWSRAYFENDLSDNTEGTLGSYKKSGQIITRNGLHAL